MLMTTILITTDPYLKIRNNELTMIQDIAIIKRGYSNIEHSILPTQPITKNTVIRCFGIEGHIGIIRRIEP